MFKKPRVKEYGTFPESERSIKTRIAARAGQFNRLYVIYHCTAGYEPAGSAARWTDEKWISGFIDNDGTFHGMGHKSEARARIRYDFISKPL